MDQPGVQDVAKAVAAALVCDANSAPWPPPVQACHLFPWAHQEAATQTDPIAGSDYVHAAVLPAPRMMPLAEDCTPAPPANTPAEWEQEDDACSTLPPGGAASRRHPSLLRRSAIKHGTDRLAQHVTNRPRYERRPYTARRFMEALLFEGGAPGHRIWCPEQGTFWAPAYLPALPTPSPGTVPRMRPASAAVASQQTAGCTPLMTGPWPWWHPALRGASASLAMAVVQTEPSSALGHGCPSSAAVAACTAHVL